MRTANRVLVELGSWEAADGASLAAGARGLVLLAERHSDDVRAAASYLDELAARAPERGVRVWLVEVRAVRVDPIQVMRGE